MATISEKLSAQWREANRYRNFGSCLRSLRIQGFRGLADLTVDFDFPVTAISGLNATGKSTIGQIAVCAYKKPATAQKYGRYYVANFFPVSILDPTPFTEDARSTYQYETDVPDAPQDVTVSRARVEWSGYKRQPERQCHYVGFTLYIPKVEQRDLTVYGSRNLVEAQRRPIDNATRDKVANILGLTYEEVAFQGVTHGTRNAEVGTVSRNGSRYSESHMGFGEGRVLYMLDLLENSAPQSLFIIEEPETSLHEDAQNRLGNYFLDVCERRKHQIILSTHSSVLLSALPSPARKFLARGRQGVEVYNGIAGSHARALLSGGAQKALQVCVEDKAAQLILQLIVLKADRPLIKALNISPVGSKQTVQEAVRLMRDMGVPGIGIRDADVGEAAAQGLYNLPGTRPPEVELFQSASVLEKLDERFSVNFGDWHANNSDVDHHHWMSTMAHQIGVAKEYLESSLAEAYVDSLDDEVVQRVIRAIVENLPQR